MIRVKVPATTSNLGPGFDALGLALNLYNIFEFSETDGGLEIINCEDEYNNENNLIYTSMLKVFEKADHNYKGIKIILDSNIPISRGLGSSGSCILAGVIGANEIIGSQFSKDEVFKIATEIEGHPDNIAPALYGGLITSIMDEGEVYYNRANIKEGIKFVALIPDFTISTKMAREVLPKSISYKDGVNNVGRVSLLLSSLINGRFDLLKIALKDRLHEPYRSGLIPGFEKILEKSYEFSSFGTYLSGAGPTIMSIVNQEDNDYGKNMKDYFLKNKMNWDVIELGIDLNGSTIEKTAR